MVRLLSDYIVTPLGEGVADNIKAILDGDTAIAIHNSVHGEVLVEGVMASLLDSEKYKIEGYSLFESVSIYAVSKALEGCNVDVKADGTVFVISSTKGDIWKSIADSASDVARYFGNRNKPIVVLTACTSGVSAQLTAWRLLESGAYDTAIIVGCDIQSEFTVSGFQALKAVSGELCKPFDKDRCGLNLGEAAACMVVSTKNIDGAKWCLNGGSIHNDANHISGPSRTAEGSLRCLNDVVKLLDTESIGCISVHGTGTLYNDEMESIAIHRAGLDSVPVSALKGIYGHTMGAAGVLETVLTMHAADMGLVLPTRGFHEQGTTYKVSISNKEQTNSKPAFIKLLSGFGGVNAAVAWKRVSNEEANNAIISGAETLGAETDAKVGVTCGVAERSMEVVERVTLTVQNDIMALYRAELESYPKFFKMDILSRLGWLGTELLLKKAGLLNALDTETTAIILASRCGSLKNDRDYNKTIEDKENYYPSPSLFVYTLPNIVSGEIAIKEHIMGETSCYVLSDKSQLDDIVNVSARYMNDCYIIAGWIDCESADRYEAELKLIRIKTI